MKAILLENIRSLNNVWAIFRTADAAWYDRVVLVGYTPTPPRKEISKTALGAETWVPWEYYTTITEAIDHYKSAWCTIIALEKNTVSHDIGEYTPTKNIAVIVGNELEWVTEEAQKKADVIYHLPMHGKKESLNVAVAAGIAMYILSSLSLK